MKKPHVDINTGQLAVSRRNNCRACFSTNLFIFLDLGEMPLAGGFLATEDEFASEVKIPLRVYFCRECGLAQVLDVVSPEILFKKYQYISSVIPSLVNHFAEYATFLKERYLDKKGSRLLEFGCNDGVLLEQLRGDTGIVAFGIDPSENVSRMALTKGLNVTVGYFNEENALEMHDRFGRMNVVTGSNVFAHVDDVHEILRAAKAILEPEGVFIVEVHYLKDLLKDFQYDTIYHEHLSYYSVKSLEKLFTSEQFKLIDVVPLPMHGGAIRAVAALQESKRPVCKSVAQFLTDEKKYINEPFLAAFKEKVSAHKNSLRKMLDSLKHQGKSIVGYGAPGRGTILLNYCGVDGRYLDYIVDSSPLRAGKFMPGVHVPIMSPEYAHRSPPDYFFILAWNYAHSIFKQEQELAVRGTSFLVPFPEIRVIT